MICGPIWDDRVEDWHEATRRWHHRAGYLIPVGSEISEFSASRIFAAVYPEAIDIAAFIASPTWRSRAAGNTQQQRFIDDNSHRLGRPDYQPADGGDVIAHWMKYDSWRAPSRPHSTFPQTREHRPTRPAKTSPQSLERQERGALWFGLNRRGGKVVLHHRHIRPVLIRGWSRTMDGIAATIWASRTTSHPVNDR